MDGEFRQLLEDATGVSNFVIAANLDIRGFSAFSKKVESPEVAMFIKRVYMKLIDGYFSEASFIKATGDGLLVLIDYTEDSLKSVVNEVIGSCFKVLNDFGSFCDNEPMINFEVPQKIGIGLARGSACCLVSGDSEEDVLDYSGKVLNLATRLMDFARPSGLVFDGNFGIELLPEDEIELFESEEVYIRGVAEREPMKIYYTKDFTVISPQSTKPIEEVEWERIIIQKTFKEIKELTGWYMYRLPTEPKEKEQVEVTVAQPLVVDGRKKGNYDTQFGFDNFEYGFDAGTPFLRLNTNDLITRLKNREIKSTWQVVIRISYPKA